MAEPTVHAGDCAPCDAARAVVAELAVQLDPLDHWPDVEVGGGSVQDWAVSTVAGVLHRHLLGQQPGGGHRG